MGLGFCKCQCTGGPSLGFFWWIADQCSVLGAQCITHNANGECQGVRSQVLLFFVFCLLPLGF
jgi:hypothetical protein